LAGENRDESFGDALRRLRMESHLTQKDLAELSGISRTYIIMLEKGKAPAPSDEVSLALEKALHIPEGTLRDIAHLERTPADVRGHLKRALREKERLQEVLLFYLAAGAPETTTTRKLRQLLRERAALEGSDTSRPLTSTQAAAALRQLGIEEKKKLALSLLGEIEKFVPEGILRPRDEILQRLRQAIEERQRSNVSTVHLRKIPLISKTPAGEARSFSDGEFPPGFSEEFVEVPDDLGDSRAFALRVEGDSMEPLYLNGDIVVVSPQTVPREGMVVVAKVGNGEVTCKQLRYEGDLIILVPQNPRYPPQRYRREEIHWIYPVVKTIRDEIRFFHRTARY